MVQRAIGVLCTDMGYRILPPKQDSGWFCNTLLLLSKIDHGIRIYTRLAKRLIRTGLVTMIKNSLKDEILLKETFDFTKKSASKYAVLKLGGQILERSQWIQFFS